MPSFREGRRAGGSPAAGCVPRARSTSSGGEALFESLPQFSGRSGPDGPLPPLVPLHFRAPSWCARGDGACAGRSHRRRCPFAPGCGGLRRWGRTGTGNRCRIRRASRPRPRADAFTAMASVPPTGSRKGVGGPAKPSVRPEPRFPVNTLRACGSVPPDGLRFRPGVALMPSMEPRSYLRMRIGQLDQAHIEHWIRFPDYGANPVG